MKTYIFILALVAIHPFDSFSQQDTTKRSVDFIAKTDILFTTLGVISNVKIASLTLETCFNHRHSAQITALYNSYDGPIQTSPSQTPSQPYKIFQIISEYKCFIIKEKDYAGFYYGLSLKWMDYNYSNINFSNDVAGDTTKYTWNIISGGLILGYQNYFGKRFTYDFLAGWGHGYVLNKTVLKPTDVVDGSSFYTDLRLAINVGYRF